jgi:hypothetical protein
VPFDQNVPDPENGPPDPRLDLAFVLGGEQFFVYVWIGDDVDEADGDAAREIVASIAPSEPEG